MRPLCTIKEGKTETKEPYCTAYAAMKVGGLMGHVLEGDSPVERGSPQDQDSRLRAMEKDNNEKMPTKL